MEDFVQKAKKSHLSVSSALRRDEEPFASSRKVLVPSEGDKRKKGLLAEVRSCSFAEHCNTVWIEVEKELLDKNKEFLKRSLVGRFGWGGLDLSSVLRKWAQSCWKYREAPFGFVRRASHPF